MSHYTPLSVYLPLRVKLLLLGVAGVMVVVGAALGIALVIDWAIQTFQ